MDQDLKIKLAEQSVKIDEIYASIEKMRKYFLIATWVTILAVVLPALGLAIFGPSFFNSYTKSLEIPAEY